MFRILLIIFTFIYINLFSQVNDSVYVTLNSSNSKNHTEIFQHALNKKEGKVLKILVKKGNYFVDNSLVTARSNTSIIFEKGAVLNFTSNISSGFIVQNDFFTLKNAYIKGNRKSAMDFYSGYAVLLSGVEHCNIFNNTFDGISGNNLVFYPNAQNRGSSFNHINSNTFLNPVFKISETGDESLIMMGYSGYNYMHNNNIIQNNILDGANIIKLGIGFIGHGDNNVFKKNKISNCLGYGIVSYESQVVGNTMKNNQIIENEIRNIGQVEDKKTVKGMGIYLMTSINALISGNKIYNTLRNSDRTETLGAGAISVSLSPNVVVEKNFIDGSEMYGIVSDYSFGSKFLYNFVQNTSKSGALFLNMNDVTISGNTFKNIGEVVLKGRFENTSLPYIKEQLRGDTYKNIDTGNNFIITNNKFYSDKEILYFVGSEADPSRNNPGNLIKNNVVKNNQIFGNSKKQEELINFRKANNFKNNILYNTVKKKLE